MAAAPRMCRTCKERPAVDRGQKYCAACALDHEAVARDSRAYRAREKARKAGPPKRLELDEEQTVALVAALRVLDAAREVLHAKDVWIRRRGPLADPVNARLLALDAVNLAEAFDDALALIRQAVPEVMPPGPRPRPRLGEAIRAAIDQPHLGYTSGTDAGSDVRS